MILTINLVFGLMCGAHQASAEPAWSVLKSEHFVVHYMEGGSAFAGDVLQKAEDYYDEILRELGFPRRANFWLWENRCRIYLYLTKESFRKATSQPEWSAGIAVPSERALVSYDRANDFLNSILRHEMAHLIFHDFLGIRNNHVPLWLDEGIAMTMEEKKRSEFDLIVQKMVREKSWIPVEAIEKMRSLKGTSTPEAAFFYAQSQSLVRFIKETRDSHTFLQFCRDLRDGNRLQDALRKNYPRDFETLEHLEKKWVMSHGF